MTEKPTNFKKITEPLAPVQPFEPLKDQPVEMEDPIELTETLPDDEGTAADIEPANGPIALETPPDAPGEPLEEPLLIETEPVKKLPAPQQEDASFWAKIQAKRPRKKRSEKPVKPVSEMRWVQVRMLPIWLRVVLVLVLIAAAAALGAIVGFSVIGDGSAGDVFKKETWQHIFDIMNGK